MNSFWMVVAVSWHSEFNSPRTAYATLELAKRAVLNDLRYLADDEYLTEGDMDGMRVSAEDDEFVYENTALSDLTHYIFPVQVETD